MNLCAQRADERGRGQGACPHKSAAQGQSEGAWGRVPLCTARAQSDRNPQMRGAICRGNGRHLPRRAALKSSGWGVSQNPPGQAQRRPRNSGRVGSGSQGANTKVTLTSSLCLNRPWCFPRYLAWSQEMALALCQPMGPLLSVLPS